MKQQVSILSMPSDNQRQMWWGYIIEADGADSDGNWLGWCPIHDGRREQGAAPTAQFNFRKGILRCWGEPPCHAGQRSMSLTNVIAAMAAAVSRNA